jgi:hypothetical protein
LTPPTVASRADNGQIGRYRTQRGRAEGDLLHRRCRALPAGEVGGALEGQAQPVVADVQRVGGNVEVITLSRARDVQRPDRLLVDEDRHLLLGRQRAQRDRQRARDRSGGGRRAVAVGIDRQEDQRRETGHQRDRLALIFLTDQPRGLPAAVDVLEKIQAARVDDQPAVALRDRVHAVGDEVEGRPRTGRIGRRCRRRRGGRRRSGHRHRHRHRGRVEARRGLRCPAAGGQQKRRDGQDPSAVRAAPWAKSDLESSGIQVARRIAPVHRRQDPLRTDPLRAA